MIFTFKTNKNNIHTIRIDDTIVGIDLDITEMVLSIRYDITTEDYVFKCKKTCYETYIEIVKRLSFILNKNEIVYSDNNNDDNDDNNGVSNENVVDRI